MPTRDIIVIGGSAGAVEALIRLVPTLPADLPAAVFVVVHITPTAPTLLPAILTRAGNLPASHPVSGEPIRAGRIYIPPPDHHLLVRDGHVHLSRGPKENAHRPAVDTLFRTAAVAYGPRVVGVILSGLLDDGTAGMRAIKRMGGVAVAQSPNEALFPGMPLSAIENVDVDHVLHLKDIGPTLASLSREEVDGNGPLSVPEELMQEARIADMDDGALADPERPGTPAGLSCPECNGTLFDIQDGKLVRFRCRVGHAYSTETLFAEQGEHVEAALWSAMVALKEKAVLCRRMMTSMRQRGHERPALRFEQHMKDAEQRATLIKDLLESRGGNGSHGHEASPTELPADNPTPQG